MEEIIPAGCLQFTWGISDAIILYTDVWSPLSSFPNQCLQNRVPNCFLAIDIPISQRDFLVWGRPPICHVVTRQQPLAGCLTVVVLQLLQTAGLPRFASPLVVATEAAMVACVSSNWVGSLSVRPGTFGPVPLVSAICRHFFPLLDLASVYLCGKVRFCGAHAGQMTLRAAIVARSALCNARSS